MTGADGGRLTAFQVQVAQLFFGPPASDGFLLAGGGGALLAHGLTARPTQDLDSFTRPGAGDVGMARDQLLAAAGEHDWDVEVVQDSDTFCRLLIAGEVRQSQFCVRSIGRSVCADGFSCGSSPAPLRADNHSDSTRVKPWAESGGASDTLGRSVRTD